jgi:uncharacterized membrane protein
MIKFFKANARWIAALMALSFLLSTVWLVFMTGPG